MSNEHDRFADRLIEGVKSLKFAEDNAFHNPATHEKEQLVAARRRFYRYAIPFAYVLAHSSHVYGDHDTNRALHLQQAMSGRMLPDRWQEDIERFWFSLEQLEKTGRGKEYEAEFDKVGQLAERILSIAAPTDKDKRDIVALIAPKSDYWESILLPILAEKSHDHSMQAPRKEDAMVASDLYAWDAFICHAGEDKEAVVEPLAKELRDTYGLRVWYDRWVLTIGDSLRRKIDEGLAWSRYGIVVLSPSFFKKEWPQKELDGLVQREAKGQKVILPVWHNVTHETVMSYSPMLADKKAGSTAAGIKQLAKELAQAMGIQLNETDTETSTEEVSNPELKRLVREARATMRVDPSNAKPLRVALEQIDLLEDCTLFDKAKAILELSQEITLNSDEGTLALCDAIQFQISTNIITPAGILKKRDPEYRGLETLVGALWTMLLDAIEYNRSDDICISVARALDSVREQTEEAGIRPIVAMCAKALSSAQARSPRGSAIVQSIYANPVLAELSRLSERIGEMSSSPTATLATSNPAPIVDSRFAAEVRGMLRRLREVIAEAHGQDSPQMTNAEEIIRRIDLSEDFIPRNIAELLAELADYVSVTSGIQPEPSLSRSHADTSISRIQGILRIERTDATVLRALWEMAKNEHSLDSFSWELIKADVGLEDDQLLESVEILAERQLISPDFHNSKYPFFVALTKTGMTQAAEAFEPHLKDVEMFCARCVLKESMDEVGAIAERIKAHFAVVYAIVANWKANELVRVLEGTGGTMVIYEITGKGQRYFERLLQ